MSHSIIVSNIPVQVSDVSVLKYIMSGNNDTQYLEVLHVQPFPDQYHYINDSKGTKTLQIFFRDEDQAYMASKLFEDAVAMKSLVAIHEEHAKKSGDYSLELGETGSSSIPRSALHQTKEQPSAQQFRRMSVTIL